MNITVNTDVLQRHKLSLGEFLVLLMAYHDVDYKECCSRLVETGIASNNLYNPPNIVLSDNSKDLVARIIIDSNEKVIASKIDFTKLANKLIDLYPQGKKPGTTYNWSDSTSAIANKLKTLIAVHGFTYTEEEAIEATKKYISYFDKDKTPMRLLKYFILKTSKDGTIDSPFMSIIENNR